MNSLLFRSILWAALAFVVGFLSTYEANAACFYNVTIKPEQVYDGDTIQDVVFRMDFDLTATRTIRLMGIDTAELKGGSSRSKRKAVKARDRLRALVAQCSTLRVILRGRDSFGRGLADIFCGNTNLAKTLVDEGLAKRYKR